jgi:NTE family protein
VTTSDLALVFSGGGARAAYQVGFLKHVATRHPDLSPGILTGVSAGGIIAAHLASRRGNLAESVVGLAALWEGLQIEDVFRVDPRDLARRVTRWGFRLVSGGISTSERMKSLVDTEPLRVYLTRALEPAPDGTLPGIKRNLEGDRLDAMALTASSYTTGQSVTWIEHRGGCTRVTRDGARSMDIHGGLRIDHVMASSALPIFFPAIDVDGSWYGDGGIRLTAPLSPAIHLGARRIIAVTTRYAPSPQEADEPEVHGYPPPAQVAGVLMNAIFLDSLDGDAARLRQVNDLIGRLPENRRDGLRRIELLVLRPSQDLGRLANEFEAVLPRGFRFLVRGLGSRETRSNDMLSLLMFQQDYITRLMQLGEADAKTRADEIDEFLEPRASTRRQGT